MERLAGKRIRAFCGIGNPHAFRRMLDNHGCQVESFRCLPDHHAYTAADVHELARWATPQSPDCGRAKAVDYAVCTHKDLVKLKTDNLGGLPLYAIEIEIAIQAGSQLLETRLHSILNSVHQPQPMS
jgi:tetraacyldisaccharide 4'-kinase